MNGLPIKLTITLEAEAIDPALTNGRTYWDIKDEMQAEALASIEAVLANAQANGFRDCNEYAYEVKKIECLHTDRPGHKAK